MWLVWGSILTSSHCLTLQENVMRRWFANPPSAFWLSSKDRRVNNKTSRIMLDTAYVIVPPSVRHVSSGPLHHARASCVNVACQSARRSLNEVDDSVLCSGVRCALGVIS